MRQQFKAERSGAESTGTGRSWMAEGQMLSEGKARPAPPPHHPGGWRPKARDKPQNLVCNLLVIPPPLDIDFLHALGGFFSSLCYHHFFHSLVLSLFLSHLISLGWQKKYPWFQARIFMLLHRILPLNNNPVAFLNITRWSGAHHGNADFPQLVVISVSPVSMLTFSHLFL